MILERNILSKTDESLIREHLNAYFARVGYKSKPSRASLAFQRGSSPGTWLAISPLEWKAEVLVELKPEPRHMIKVIIVYVVITHGQLVTSIEQEFWNTELDGAISAIQTGEIQCGAIIKLANDAINQNLRSYLLLGLITVTCGFIGLFIIGSLSAAIILMSIGLVIWLTIIRRWHKRKIKG